MYSDNGVLPSMCPGASAQQQAGIETSVFSTATLGTQLLATSRDDHYYGLSSVNLIKK